MKMKKDVVWYNFWQAVQSENVLRYSPVNPNGKLDKSDQKDLDSCMAVNSFIYFNTSEH